MRPVEIVRKLCPNAKASYLAAFENGDALFEKHGVTTPLRLAHFLAQVLHESGGLSVEWENGNYSAERLMQIFGVGNHSAAVTETEARQLARNGQAIFERVYGLGNPKKARELGNTNPGDGWKYRGGGLMQTTGRFNYRLMGDKCGVDFEGNPALVLSAEHALKPALAEWTRGNCNAYADKDDILSISRIINLGNAKSTKTPNGLDDRRLWLKRAKPLCGVVTLKPKITAETGTAGAVVAAGAAAAQQAHQAGMSAGKAIGIVLMAVALAVVAYIVVKHLKRS